MGIDEEIIRQVFKMAEKGILLPMCPKCGMPLNLEAEVFKGQCADCIGKFQIIDVLWTETEKLPQA